MKRNNAFEIGSSIDNDKSWSSDNKRKIADILKEEKEPNEHSLVFKIEKRRGKPVSLVGEFFLKEQKLKELCKKLKKSLGSGGTHKDGWMEFQGECRDKLKELVKKEGYRIKS